MSNWTHVAAVVRVDHIRIPNEWERSPTAPPMTSTGEIDFDKVFGLECIDLGSRYCSSPEDWRDLDAHPEKYLPAGSEGTLQKSVWTCRSPSFTGRYTVSIFGDLRDHDNPDAIVDWFKEKIKHLWIRQAVITVENEMHGVRTWAWEFTDNN